MPPSFRAGVLYLRGLALRVARSDLLHHEVARHGNIPALFGKRHLSRPAVGQTERLRRVEEIVEDEIAGMSERKRGADEAVEHVGEVLLGRYLWRIHRPVPEHREATHPEVSLERMDFENVEIDEPRILVEEASAVLPVVAVAQPGEEKVVPAFGVHRPAPRFPLVEKRLAPGVEHLGKRPGSRRARVHVRTHPERHCRMDVAVGGVEAELLLHFRREALAQLRRGARAHGVGPHPGATHVQRRSAPDEIGIPISVHGRDVSEVVVGAVAVSQLVDEKARVFVLRPVAALGRIRLRAQGVAFSVLAPHRLVVVDQHVADSVTVDGLPEFLVQFPVV